MLLGLAACAWLGVPGRDADDAYPAQSDLLLAVCERFESIDPSSMDSIDEITRDGSVTWSERDIVGQLRSRQAEAAPDSALLTRLGASPEEIGWFRDALGSLGATRLHRWEVHGDGGGHHLYIVLRSETVFTWPTGPTLVCREHPFEDAPEPLVEQGCTPLEASQRLWRCGPEVAKTAPVALPEE